MLLRISHDRPDEEFSIAAEFRTPMMFVRGIKHEVVVTSVADFDKLAIKDARELREQLEDWLYYQNAVRLVPVN